jgi:phospholipase/carboxylesterase
MACDDGPPETGRIFTHPAFLHRLHRPPDAGADVLVLLHGSGADENSLVPLATDIDPRATLIAPRGRVVQDGDPRWFTRVTPIRFDQASIRREAAAFAAFMTDAIDRHAFDPRRIVFLGYSNGANLLTSVMLLHPGIVARAVLLRAMPVLDVYPRGTLGGTDVVIIAGAKDVTYGGFAAPLAGLLRDNGARVTSRTVTHGHEFGSEDVRIVRAWLGRPGAAA